MRTPMSWLHAREEKLFACEQSKPECYRKTYYCCFNQCLLVMVAALLLVYLSNAREPIWMTDGLNQYLPYFIYEGEWIRDIFANLINGNGFQPALWSWGLGYGSDTLATLDVFWDPLNLLSALVPAKYAEYLFSALVFARMWLAGLAFSAYALYRGHGRFATLCGSLTYCFAAPALIGVFWPGGVTALVMFPLLLLGVEKVLDGENPAVYIIAVALFFTVSYYFAYAACLFLLAYCTARVFGVERSRARKVTIRVFAAWVGRFFVLLIVGVFIACVALLPSASMLLGTDRATEALAQIPLLYSADYYFNLIGGFISTGYAGSDCYIGFGGLAFLSCVLLFLLRGKNAAMKTAFIAMTLFVLVPFFGSAFNGFNYATNRWVWAWDMCIAYIVVLAVPHLMALEKEQCRALIIATAIYGMLVLLVPQMRIEKVIAAFAMLAILLLTILIVQKSTVQNKRWGILLVLMLSLFVNAFYFSAADEGGLAESSLPATRGYAKLTTESPNSLVSEIDDDSWWRYDVDPSAEGTFGGDWERVYNSSLVQGLNGIDFYNSFYNNDIDHYHSELAIAADDVNFMYHNLGGRSILEMLNNVKYYVAPSAGGITPVYGYDDSDNIVASGSIVNTPCVVYEGSDTLPLGYTFKNVISRSSYESLTPIQKQEALLQGAVVEDVIAENSSVDEIEPKITSTTVDSQIASTNGVTVLDDGSFIATVANATVTLSVAGISNSETYLSISNLSFDAYSSFDLLSAEDLQALPWYKKAQYLSADMSFTPSNTYYLYAQSDKGSANRFIVNSVKSWHMYGGKSDWALNLGYSDEAQSTVTITLPVVGHYSFDDLSVVCQPMDEVSVQVDALSEDVLTNTQVGIDAVTGSISLDTAKRLYFSIPYSDGWTATVDGQQVAIDKTDTAFMSIELEPGEHEVELTYFTPGLKAGMFLSLLGLVLFAGIIPFHKKRVARLTYNRFTDSNSDLERTHD